MKSDHNNSTFHMIAMVRMIMMAINCDQGPNAIVTMASLVLALTLSQATQIPNPEDVTWDP